VNYLHHICLSVACVACPPVFLAQHLAQAGSATGFFMLSSELHMNWAGRFGTYLPACLLAYIGTCRELLGILQVAGANFHDSIRALVLKCWCTFGIAYPATGPSLSNVLTVLIISHRQSIENVVECPMYPLVF
jgi:hypothetical protein